MRPSQLEHGGEDPLGGDHAPDQGLVLAEQVKQLYAVAPVGVLATLVNSLVVFFVTRDVTAYAAIAFWLAGIWALTSVRIGLIAWFRASPPVPEAAPRWERRFLVALVASGLAWGSIGLFPFAGESLAHQVFLAFVLGGMAAGASSAFSVVKHGYAAFAIPALTPLAVRFALVGDLFHHAMGAMVLLFALLLWRIARHNYALHRTSLLLRFENRAMIDSLKAAKEHVEGLNAQLVAEIDARVHAEAELRRNHERLERLVEERTADLSRLNRELEQFAYVASHDLKAPLRAVANLALVIDEDAAEQLDAENRRRLQLLRERVQRMDRLIEGMLAYARLGQRSGVTANVALAGVIDELRSELPLPAGFVVDWEEPLPELNADPVHVRQIFQNLLANAVEHHDRADGHVRVRARDADGHWQLDVADDGPGIPEGERQQLFRMFATSGKAGHTGIGLAVVRKLVLGYGGEVEALANHPRGTVIRITWPK